MPAFILTDNKTGKRYKVTGPSKERALEVWKDKQVNGELETKRQSSIDPETMQPEGVPEFQPPGVEGYDPKTGEVDNSTAIDKAGAFSTAATDAVPIVGPTLTKATNAAAAGLVTPFSDQSFAENYKEMGGYGARAQEENPGYALGGRVVGTVAPMIGVGATVLGAKALGQGAGSLLARTGASSLSNAGISGADTAARGGDLTQTLQSAAIGGTIGAAIPGAGELANTLGSAVKGFVAPKWNAIVRPGQEAARRVNEALKRDADNIGAPVLDAYDEAAARVNNQPLINVDRGGESTRALARSAANSDPEARALINKTADDRFATQGDRALSFIDRISHGTADDLAAQDAISAAAKRTNKPAYDAANKAAAAQNMDSPELLGMLASPAVRDAAMAAETRGANRAVVEGFQPVKNPFVIDANGTVSLRDPKVKPTLQFWDQVKRNLDAEIGKASRAGDKPQVADLTALKSKLVAELDAAVPEYKAARQGAAAFFDAEDALDAGRKYVTQTRDIRSTERALQAMAPAERRAFAVGFAAQLKDAIKATPDRTNLIKKMFGTPQAREKIRLALGQKNFNEFEQFVKVENAMDTLRGSMGNSKTAQFLIEAGMAGTGTGLLTGDWKQGLTAAIITGAVRKYGGKVDDRMTKQIAQLLLSDDPTALQRAATMAANNPQAAAAVEAIQTAIGSALRGAGTEVTRPPLELSRPNNAPMPAQ